MSGVGAAGAGGAGGAGSGGAGGSGRAGGSGESGAQPRGPRLSWADATLVFHGGVVGTAMRYGLGELTDHSTIIVNIVGALLLGFLVAMLPDPRVRTVLGTGLLGSFTTYGAFAAEIRLELLDSVWIGGLLLGAILIAGYAAALVGLWLGRRVRGGAS